MHQQSASVALLYGHCAGTSLVAPATCGEYYQRFNNVPSPRCCGACGGHVMRDHRPILAERFKTKMCRNYMETGHCPYVFRCMFAHGEHELRTPTMNLADGLTTEEAIKAFKRAQYEHEKAELATLFSAGIVLSSGRTRHDPYAEAAVWHPLGTPSARPSPTGTGTALTPTALFMSSASTVSSSSARSSPVPPRSPAQSPFF